MKPIHKRVGELAQRLDALALELTQDLEGADREVLLASAAGVLFAFRTGVATIVSGGEPLNAEELAEKCRATPWIALTRAAASSIERAAAEEELAESVLEELERAGLVERVPP